MSTDLVPTDTPPAVSPIGETVPATRPPTDAELRPLLERGINSDHEAVRELMHLLRDDPERFIRLGSGDAAAVARRLVVKRQHYDRDVLGLKAQLLKLERMQAEIEGPNPTPLERLLASRVVMTWFHVNIFEIIISMDKPRSPEEMDHYEKRRGRAHREHLAAIKTLAQVRRLQLPAVQVNIAADGGQQVNVAGG